MKLKKEEVKDIEKGLEFVSLSGAFCKPNIRLGNNPGIARDMLSKTILAKNIRLGNNPRASRGICCKRQY